MQPGFTHLTSPRTLGTLALSMWIAGCGSTAALIFDAPESARETKAKAPPPPALILPASEAPAPMPRVQDAPPSPAVTEVKTAAAPPPAAAPVSDPRDALTAVLNAWRDAWASRDTDAYLKHYQAGFKGQESSAEQWQTKRKQVIAKAGKIDLRLGEPKIALNGADEASIQVEQFYRSSKTRDEGIKQLRLQRIEGRWLIVEERFTPGKK